MYEIIIFLTPPPPHPNIDTLRRRWVTVKWTKLTSSDIPSTALPRTDNTSNTGIVITNAACLVQPRIQEFVIGGGEGDGFTRGAAKLFQRGGGGGGRGECSPLTAIYQNWGRVQSGTNSSLTCTHSVLKHKEHQDKRHRRRNRGGGGGGGGWWGVRGGPILGIMCIKYGEFILDTPLWPPPPPILFTFLRF